MKKPDVLEKPDLRLSAPIGDHVIIKLPEHTKMIGRIHIPDTARSDKAEAGMEALVVGVGETASLGNDVFPKAGDWVLVSQYAGKWFTGLDGTPHKVINGKDVLATLEVYNG